jgi:hypothetical protein
MTCSSSCDSRRLELDEQLWEGQSRDTEQCPGRLDPGGGEALRHRWVGGEEGVDVGGLRVEPDDVGDGHAGASRTTWSVE